MSFFKSLINGQLRGEGRVILFLQLVYLRTINWSTSKTTFLRLCWLSILNRANPTTRTPVLRAKPEHITNYFLISIFSHNLSATYHRFGMNGTKFQPRQWMWYTAEHAAHPSIDMPIFPGFWQRAHLISIILVYKWAGSKAIIYWAVKFKDCNVTKKKKRR